MKPMMKLRLLCRDGMRACERGDLGNALFQLHMALRLTKGLQSDILEAKVRNNMGLVLMLMGDDVRALGHLRLAQKLTENFAGTRNSLFRSVTRNLVQASLAVDRTAGLAVSEPLRGPEGPRMHSTDAAA
ncbi:tetratricopeptide repeat protein [Desulfocurvus sp. DL9XJH121]